MKDYKVWVSNVDQDDGSNEIVEVVYYNLTTEKAEINRSINFGKETTLEISEFRFKDDLKLVIKLAKAQVEVINGKIGNNMMVISSMRSSNREKEIQKATKHLENNEKRLVLINSIIEKYE